MGSTTRSLGEVIRPKGVVVAGVDGELCDCEGSEGVYLCLEFLRRFEGARAGWMSQNRAELRRLTCVIGLQICVSACF